MTENLSERDRQLVKENAATWLYLRADVAVVCDEGVGEYARLRALVSQPLPAVETHDGIGAVTAYINGLIERYQLLYLERITSLLTRHDVSEAMSRQTGKSVWQWVSDIKHTHQTHDDHAYEKIGALLEHIESAITSSLDAALRKAQLASDSVTVKEKVMALVHWYGARDAM